MASRVIIPQGTPVNGKPGGCIATVVARPANYTRPVQSFFELEFSRQPHSLVELTAATGIINMTTVGVENEEFVIGTQTFKFVVAYSEPARLAGEVLIAAGAGAQETNIKLAIVLDRAIILASATEDGNRVLVTATTPGAAGNDIAFSTTATGMVMTTTNAGFLGGGLDAVSAETIEIDGVEYTFIANGETPGATEIELGSTLDDTLNNITAIEPQYLVITSNRSDTLIFTATEDLEGEDGDGIVIAASGYATGGVTANGALEKRNRMVVNGKSYTFTETASTSLTHLTTDYPTDIPVATVSNASVTVTAAAWVVKLKLDTAVFSATSVSNTDGVVTINHKTNGIIGNDVTYVNSLGTAGNITTTGITDGKFTGGQEGTLGFDNEVLMDDTYVYFSLGTSSSITANWRRVALGSVY